MNVIDFKEARCKNCYKCVRNCDLKAIAVKDSQAYIMDDKCILCGRCLEICPQNAKAFVSDLDKVKKFIADGIPTIASIAPSYLGVLAQKEPGQVITALKRLGFLAVRETAEGAALITEEYSRLLSEGKMENILTTCCPSANELVEIYYPELVPYMAPVVSPMIAHGKLLRKLYAERVKIVFIGPCISKKREAAYDPRTSGFIDAVLNFNELEDWICEEHISLAELPPSNPDNPDPAINRLYPISGGVVSSVLAQQSVKKDPLALEDVIRRLAAQGAEDFGIALEQVAAALQPQQDTYQKLHADGLADCMELLGALKKGELSHCFIELNVCHGGCIKGPGTRKARTSSFRIRTNIDTAVEKHAPDTGTIPAAGIPLARTFCDRSVSEELPSEETLAHILRKFGKAKPEDMLNCGACGYPTCRDKAIAVYQGKAETEMCLPYMHSRAQSMSNMVMDITPNIIIIADSDMRVVEFSKAAERQFHTSSARARDMYLQDFIDPSDFMQVLKTHESILGKRVIYKEMGLATLQNIVYMPEQNCVLGIFQDVTAEEEQNRQAYKMKMDTIEMAQHVIDKQMMVAQEIAGLLGETTAETKVTLTKLRDTIIHDGKTGGI